MKYRYSVAAGQTDTNGRYTKRPIVEIELSRGNQTRKFLALVDSGADQIHMPAAIAEVFGINRAECPRRASMGITMEHIDGFVAELTFRIEHQTETFNAPIVFIDTDLPVLLGREGFFDRYRIKFEQDHDTFEITPAKNVAQYAHDVHAGRSNQ
jgi:hypothetical protein